MNLSMILKDYAFLGCMNAQIAQKFQTNLAYTPYFPMRAKEYRKLAKLTDLEDCDQELIDIPPKKMRKN